MINPLIGIHIGLGELGIIAFLWVFVELLNPSPARIKRAKIASVIGVVSFILAWVSGGAYYLTEYGEVVKPLIKTGPAPWAHYIFTETKEHVFLFLPFIAAFASGLLFTVEDVKKNKKALLIISATVVILGFSMAAMGYLISSGAREALEASL